MCVCVYDSLVVGFTPHFVLDGFFMNDRLLGTVGFALSVAAYVYYTAWVLVTPFIDKKVEWFHNLFPNRWWAFAVPTTLLVFAVTSVAMFVGVVSVRSTS